MIGLKPFDADYFERVRRGIVHVFGAEVRVLPPIKLPKEAYYPPRKRYRADTLVDFMTREVAPAHGRRYVLGVTKRDISTSTEEHEDWGILGLAALGGPSGVVSTFRIGRRLGVKGRKAKYRKKVQRVVKIANHELGHLFGLPHIEAAPECMMNDAHGSILTVDAEKGTPCPSTRRFIETNLGVVLPERDVIDWGVILAD